MFKKTYDISKVTEFPQVEIIYGFQGKSHAVSSTDKLLIRHVERKQVQTFILSMLQSRQEQKASLRLELVLDLSRTRVNR